MYGVYPDKSCKSAFIEAINWCFCDNMHDRYKPTTVHKMLDNLSSLLVRLTCSSLLQDLYALVY